MYVHVNVYYKYIVDATHAHSTTLPHSFAGKQSDSDHVYINGAGVSFASSPPVAGVSRSLSRLVVVLFYLQ